MLLHSAQRFFNFLPQQKQEFFAQLNPDEPNSTKVSGRPVGSE
jgi:hypothetical protein